VSVSWQRLLLGVESRFSACGLLFLLTAGWALEPTHELYVVNTKPASVSVVDAESWKVIGEIPIGEQPTFALLGHNKQLLYVLHAGMFGPPQDTLRRYEPKAPSSVTVVSLEGRKVVKTIPLGWNVATLVSSADGRYLLAYGKGRLDQKNPSKAEYLAAVHVIDTERNEIVAVIPAGRYLTNVLFTRDVSRIFVLGAHEVVKQGTLYWPVRKFLVVRSLGSDKPLAEIELDDGSDEMLLSGDEKWLYVVERRWADPKTPWQARKQPDNGKIHVVDVGIPRLAASHEVGLAPRGLNLDAATDTIVVLSQASGKDELGKLHRLRAGGLISVVDVGANPRFAVRCDGQAGIHAVSQEDVRFVPDKDRPPAGSVVPLNRQMERLRVGAKSKGQSLGGDPTLALCVPKSGRLALLTPNGRMGVVNLEENELEKVWDSSPLWAELIGGALAGAALGGLTALAPQQSMIARSSFYAGYAAAGRSANLAMGPSSLVARPDGGFLYWLDSSSGLVALVRLADRSIVGQVRVGTGCLGLHLLPGGKFISGVHTGSVTLIDTVTNKEHYKHRFPEEKVNGAFVREQGRQIVVLTNKSLAVLDVERAKMSASIQGLGDPAILVDPHGEGESSAAEVPREPEQKQAPPEPKPEPPKTGGAPAEESAEVAYWNTVRSSDDPQLFEMYLRRYPNGLFAELARNKIELAKQARAKAKEPATVHVYLPSDQTRGVRPTIFCDKEPLVRLSRGTFFTVKLSPGERVFRVGRLSAKPYLGVLEGGKEYYLRITTLWTDRAELVPEAVGKDDLKRLKPAPD